MPERMSGAEDDVRPEPAEGQPEDAGRVPEPGGPSAEPDWVRRRRLAAVFGDVLPDTTADERAPEEERDGAEEWLRRQVPPHHG
ncbi:hypothetical protein [Nocardioides donggukensis]|uniref:Uncharacterized protein n=1 Tax=Nocardioides donggukensis TaxID=2774019 RepID=A0A927KAL3_9ACTN|nr:hypothetical protein [Nocardioides donggukensis]MBD8870700.1 hypothetical protein [Nocardioides donggukensis]